MKMSKTPYPAATLCSLKGRIDPTPDYQRPPVWSRKQKQLLLDSILRGYDIPKMYWREVEREDGIQFEVIDGQQRLRTLWEFREGEFKLARDMDRINGKDCAGKAYSELPSDLVIQFDSYPVDVVIVRDAVMTDEEDEVRDMFLRLQNGTTLKAQEKRNAMPGAMRDFIKSLSEHAFFEKCRFSNSRYTYDLVAAQLTRLELAGGPVSIRNADLNRMYADNTSFDASGPKARKVRRVLDFLGRAFPEKTPELERYNVVTLYCIASSLLESYVHQGLEPKLRDWFLSFETERRAQEQLPEDERDPQLVEYRRLTSQSTDGEESIRARLDVMEKRFFLAEPDIQLKDTNRHFLHEQRLAIFRKDQGRCQIRKYCDGDKLVWGDWHADHITPHSKGGQTVVSNGQASCARCNTSKGSRESVGAG